jgi:hypothetical protein
MLGEILVIVRASMHLSGPPDAFPEQDSPPAGAIDNSLGRETGKLVQPLGGATEIPGNDIRAELSA